MAFSIVVEPLGLELGAQHEYIHVRFGDVDAYHRGNRHGLRLPCLCMRARAIPALVTVRATGRPARRPCALYSETGSNAQAGTKLHGPVWLPQRPPDSTALVWLGT